MFTFFKDNKKEVPVELKETTRTIPRPVAESVSLVSGEEEGAKAYAEVAESIGFNPLSYKYSILRIFLKKNDIPIFDNDKVGEYLESKLVPGKHWQWTPLRESDMEPESKFNWYAGYAAEGKIGLQMNTYSLPSCGMTFPKQRYNQLVPKSILLQVGKIATEFPDARFYVSEIRDIPDPFICVSFENSSNRNGDSVTRIIFGTWDEPGW